MRQLLSLLIAALASPALAAGVLPFEGAFGNAGGCSFYNTGTPPAGDDYFLLTADTFASYGTACDFAALVSNGKAVFTVKAVCQTEGEEDAGPDHLRVIDHGSAGYGVQFDGLEEWGPFKACPPVQFDGSSEVQL